MSSHYLVTEPIAGASKISSDLRIILCSHVPTSCTVVPILTHTSHLQALRARLHFRVLVLFSWARLLFPLDIYELVPSFPLGFMKKSPFQECPHPPSSSSMSYVPNSSLHFPHWWACISEWRKDLFWLTITEKCYSIMAGKACDQMLVANCLSVHRLNQQEAGTR